MRRNGIRDEGSTIGTCMIRDTSHVSHMTERTIKCTTNVSCALCIRLCVSRTIAKRNIGNASL